MPEEITFFAETNYRGQNRRFGIKKDDRRRHMYLIGKTGMGKTTMLEHMVYSDIINGNGLAVVDPHGDFAEKMIDYVPSNRINDVVYFNPADIDWPIAFNVMEKVDKKYTPLVASGLIGVFKKIWSDSWGPRLEYVLRNAILALLEYPGSTLLGVPRILVDKIYRQKVVRKITDPVVKSFWVDEFSRYPDKFQTEAISPIQNKIGQFLSNSLVRNIIAQTKSAIDLRKIMDDKKILIINLSKGRVGEDYSALLGAMMITKIQLAAMSRVDIPELTRNDFYLYVDEFQNFATESFANILSEARKYRLNLIIAHQYVGQLVSEQNTVVRDAVFGNVGTIVAFRIGAADAEFLEKEFEPVFMMNDLVNLPKYNVYLKLMIDGVTSDAFSATTLVPLGEKEKTNNGDKIIKNSRQRYATERRIIEEKIIKWSGAAGSDTEEEIFAKGKNGGKKPESFNSVAKKNLSSPSPAVNGISGVKPASVKTETPKIDERKWYDAVCQKCSKSIQVPFQPDPARKTYCRECLRLVREEAQKGDKFENRPESASPSQRESNFQPDKIAKMAESSYENTDTGFITLAEAVKAKPVSFSRKKENYGAKPMEEKAEMAEQEPEKVLASEEEEKKPAPPSAARKPIPMNADQDLKEKNKKPESAGLKKDLKIIARSGKIKPLEKAKFE